MTPLQIKVMTASVEGARVNATLIAGREDAVLIDTQFLMSDVNRLVSDIVASGKRLTTVYVTHSHPDHYFGLPVIKQAFPSARTVALPAVIERMHRTRTAKVAEFRALFGSNIAADPIVPEPLRDDVILLEGQRLEIKSGLQGDEAENSYVAIPCLDALICGDIAYSGVYPWTLETTPEERKTWIAVLDAIAGLKPSIVVAGHKNPKMPDDVSSIHFTKEYLTFFDEAWPTAKNADELQAAIRARFPDLDVDFMVQMAAQAVFAPH